MEVGQKVVTLGERFRKLVEQSAALGVRLDSIAKIIEKVDQRCMAADGPVTQTLDEMNLEEIREIYQLALGRRIEYRKDS